MLEKIIALAPFVPLLQTLTWVILILVLVLWFDSPLRAVLAVIRKRIETGSAMKAGWFELSELKPEPPEQQRQRAEREVAEAEASAQSATAPGDPVQVGPTSSQFLVAEDLALRALQADLGVPLNRQVSAGMDAGFDAAFARDGTLNIVEVKFFPGSVTPMKLKNSLERISAAVRRVHWRNVRVVLVLVYKRADDIAPNEMRVREAIEGYDLPVEVRTFSLQDLKIRFGVRASDA